MGNGVRVPRLILIVGRQLGVLLRQLQKGLTKWGKPVLTMDGTIPWAPGWNEGKKEVHWRTNIGGSELEEMHWRTHVGGSELEEVHWRTCTGGSKHPPPSVPSAI